MRRLFQPDQWPGYPWLVQIGVRSWRCRDFREALGVMDFLLRYPDLEPPD